MIRCLFTSLFAILSVCSLYATIGGPDTHGYTFKDRFEPGGPAVNWIDITSTGTQVIGAANNASSNASPPIGIGSVVKLGHPFTFYGVTYDQLVPAVDGFLSTNPSENGADNTRDQPLPATPSSGSGGRIYVNHRNWQTSGGVYYQYFKESPHPYANCGVSIFSWTGMTPSGAGGVLQRFQVLLFDSGDIVIQSDILLGTHLGDNETIGIQNPAASSGLSYGHPTPVSNTNLTMAVLFEHVYVGGGTGTLQSTINNAPAGSKIIFGSTSTLEDSDLVINKPLTLIGSNFAGGVAGTLRYGLRAKRSSVTVSGALVNIFDAHFRSAPSVAMRVINGGHLHLCNTSLLGSGSNAVVVEQNGELTMRRSEVSDPKPNSGTHVILGKNTQATLYKSLISESWEDGISLGGVGAGSLPDLEIELSSIVRNRRHGLTASGARVHTLQSTFTDNLGFGILGKSCTFQISSSNITSNDSGGVELTGSSSITLDHCIIAENRSATTGELLNFSHGSSVSETSQGSNVCDTKPGFLTSSGDLTLTDPKLTPLGGYGERIGAASPRLAIPLMCQIPLHQSPVIDASASASQVNLSGNDLRNTPRLANGDNAGVAILDIGAVEAPSFVTVTTTADQNDTPAGGSVSLREALRDATGQRIVFASGLNGQTINLSSSAGGQGNGLTSGDFFNFVDASSLSSGITVSGGGDLSSPLLSSVRFVHGLTLTQGKHSAVRNFGGPLVMSSCTFSSNTQQNSTNTQNYALYGGGVFNGDVAFLTDCTFRSNFCSTNQNAFVQGGGFAAFPSAGTGLVIGVGVNYLVGCRFEENIADFIAGGISISGGRKTVIDRCTIIRNRAGGSAGGRIAANDLDETYVDITRSSIVDNTATGGHVGGLSLTGTSHFDPADEVIEQISLSYCTFSGNLVADRNVGAFLVAAAEVHAFHCTITDNQADLIGGIQVGEDGTLRMNNSILDNNLSIFNAQFTASNLTLTDNGVFISEGNNLSGNALTNLNHPSDLTNTPPLLAPLTQSTVATPTRHPLHSSPAIDGGSGSGFAIDGRGFPGRQGSRVDIGAVEAGLAVVVTTAVDEFNTPSGTNVSLREALRDAREGSRVIFSPAHVASGATIDLRTTATGQGTPLESAKNLVVDATMLPEGVTIYGAGTGLRCLTLPDGAQSFSLHGVSFRNGLGATNGSAVHKGLQTDLTITHSAIYNCISTNNAAAIHANGGFLTLENVTLYGNSSSSGGSAVSGRNGAQISLRHSTIFGNSIYTNNFPGGAAIFLETNASLECNHVAIGENQRTVSSTLRNLLRFGPTTIGDIFFTHADDSTIPGASNVGAVKLRPLQQAGGFASTCPPDIGSPVVNSGYAIFSGSPPTDARGFARKYGTKVDIGAYELGSFLPGTTDPPVDIDNDGMDYFWEEYYGLIPGNDDSGTDTDLDGLSALGEYLSQTNPGVFDPIEPLKIVDFVYDPTSGRIWLTFSSTPGIAYSVWHSADLSPNSLTSILNIFGASGGNQTLVIIESSSYGGGTKGFFRVQRP